MQINLTFYMKYVEILRRVAFVLSLLALCTAVLWIHGGTFLDKVDKKIKKSHVKNYHSQYSEAKSLSIINPDEAIHKLLGLLNEVQEVKGLDRLANVKASALELLAKIYKESGQDDKSLRWAKKWTEFDNKDLRARALYAEYLLESEGGDDEAKRYISELYKLVPEADFVAELYAELLFREGENIHAVLILLDLYKKTQKSMPAHWQYFWDLGSGFSARQVAFLEVGIDSQASLRIPFEVIRGVVRVRIDPPPFSKLRLRDLVIKQTPMVGPSLIDLSHTVSQFNDMTQLGNVLLTSGGEDPFFYFDWPKQLADRASEVELTGVVTPKYSDKLVKIVKSLGHESLVSELTELGYVDEAAHIDLLVEQVKRDGNAEMTSTSASGQVISVYWANIENRFSEEKRSDAVFHIEENGVSEGHFEVFFTVDSDVSHLRIDFPDITEKTYDITGIEAFVGEEVLDIDPTELDLTFDHGLEIEGSRFTVKGTDPYFSFQISKEAVGLKKLVIRGKVR